MGTPGIDCVSLHPQPAFIGRPALLVKGVQFLYRRGTRSNRPGRSLHGAGAFLRTAGPATGICLLPVLIVALLSPGCAGPLRARDSAGREIVLPKKPQSIVSLAPSNTEILFALGLGDLVQGVTAHCNYPPEIKDKATVGGYMDLSLEKIISLKPDLVLATSYQDGTVASLRELKIPVVVLDATTMSGVADCIKAAGTLTGRSREAQRLTAEMTRELNSIRDRVSSIPDAERPRVLYLAWDAPILTVGPDTLLHDMITLAGGRNIAAAAREPYPIYSIEMVIVENPDVILIPRVQSSLDLKLLRSLPAWRNVKAVREGRVYLLDDDLVSRPGPRAVQGLRQIAEDLHPDKFGAKAP